MHSTVLLKSFMNFPHNCKICCAEAVHPQAKTFPDEQVSSCRGVSIISSMSESRRDLRSGPGSSRCRQLRPRGGVPNFPSSPLHLPLVTGLSVRHSNLARPCDGAVHGAMRMRPFSVLPEPFTLKGYRSHSLTTNSCVYTHPNPGLPDAALRKVHK